MEKYNSMMNLENYLIYLSYNWGLLIEKCRDLFNFQTDRISNSLQHNNAQQLKN